MLAISELSIRSGSQELVRSLSLELQEGEWLALAGESGSGKSLTAAAIGGLLPRQLSCSGSILWHGLELLALDAKSRRRLLGREISYVFQDYRNTFTPFLTIGSQLTELLGSHLSLAARDRKQRCLEELEQAGLPAEQVFGSYPYQLSGGQLQRAAIAAALLLRPKLLIADEPTTALDSVSSRKVLGLLDAAKSRYGISIVWITHDLRHARRHADRIAVMRTGSIVETGTARQMLEHPAHPYSRRLIASIPPLRREMPERLASSAGLEGEDLHDHQR
ncbi:ATP-binding cassette domain-containing protein [Paenibacillus sp. D51F]